MIKDIKYQNENKSKSLNLSKLIKNVSIQSMELDIIKKKLNIKFGFKNLLKQKTKDGILYS